MTSGFNIFWRVVCLVVVIGFLYLVPIGLWFNALVSGVRISLVQLTLMRWRKISPQIIVRNMIVVNKTGLNVDIKELEAHYLAGGNVTSIINALILAKKANMTLDFKTAAAMDLGGRDVFQEVQMSVKNSNIGEPLR